MTFESLLLEEKIVDIEELKSHPEKRLKGFVRIISDKNGVKTNGFFFDKNAFEDLLELVEYSGPEFWESVERSRKSGRVSSKEIEKRLGIKA